MRKKTLAPEDLRNTFPRIEYFALVSEVANAYVQARTAFLFADLPSNPSEGDLAIVTNSTTAAWGAVIAGGGGNRVAARYNGSAWTVYAK